MIRQVEYVAFYDVRCGEDNRIVYYDSEMLTDEEVDQLITSGQSQFSVNVIDISLKQRKLLKKLFEQLREKN